MKKLKAFLLSLLALSVVGGAAACGEISDTSSTDSSITESTPGESTPGESTPDDSTPDDNTPDADMGAILEAAYALANGSAMEGAQTLTGVVTNVKSTGEGEACLTFVVPGYDQYPMYCYWLKGDEAGNLAVGDTITVTGTIKNYNGTIEYDKPTLVSFVKGEVPEEDPSTPSDIELSDASVVIPAAYALASGATLEGTYTLKGQITSAGSYNSSYGDINVTIVVEGYEDYPIYCYATKGTGTDKIGVGDIITVKGTIKNYKGTVEFDKPELLAWEDGTLAPSIDVTPSAGSGLSEGYQIITIEQAKAIAAVSSGESTERYYIHATISSISNYTYGAMYIEDATGSISVYGTYSADGSIGYAAMSEKPYKGDEVLLSCTLNNFNGTAEVKNARLVDFIPMVLDETGYSDMSVEDIREVEEGTKVKVDGVVAQITYASGLVPNGIYLIDGTNSIYVHDSDLAGRVAVGNTITILAEKTWWILEDEQASADKFGYKGCNQLDNAWLVSNDGQTSNVDYSWVEETTVKAIMDTPVTTDITSTVYKVNALVKKSVGNGYINYYINDLDGYTGSYVYTQANGNDLAWLEQFDGKICTVYVSVLNAKSSPTGCLWRFKVLDVKDEGFTFDKNNAAQFALDYHATTQFAASYTADPELEVISTLSSELLGFEGVSITYVSDNTNVIYFENGVMHVGTEYGTANITITASLAGYASASKTIAIAYEEAAQIDYITVAEAITTADDTTVTVKGIVGPSVINKAGFYLFGDDGSTITVLLLAESDFANIEIGQEVILTGKRERYVKAESAANTFGQSSIVDAQIVVNNMGNHAYNTAKFVEGKTTDELYALDCKTDYSTTVFVVTGTLTFPTGNGQPSIKSNGATNAFSFYCSGSSQYAFLQPYVNQVVTLEVAACNWNNKTYWRGCVLAIRLADGTKVVNPYYFDKN